MGIFFLHHALDPVTRHHLSLIRKHNPGVPVVTVSGSYERFENGLIAKHLAWNDHCWWRHTDGGQRLKAWEYSDLMLYGAYASRRIDCKRWVVFEWDVKCTRHVEDVFADVWDADLAGVRSFTYRRNPKWHWFVQQKDDLPANLRPYTAATAPFGVLLCSDQLLHSVQHNFAKLGDFKAQNETRLGTLANYFHLKAASMPKLEPYVNWLPERVKLRQMPGVYHPVKEVT